MSQIDKLPQTYSGKRKYDIMPIENNDISGMLGLCIDSLNSTRPPVYSKDEKGLNEFIENTKEYFEYIKEFNQNNPENMIIPSVENYSVFMGISRVTLLSYQNSRGEDWRIFIERVKNMIQASKMQLACKGKIPPVLYIFDSCNNGENYSNTSEFKLHPIQESVSDKEKRIEDIRNRYNVDLIEEARMSDEN